MDELKIVVYTDDDLDGIASAFILDTAIANSDDFKLLRQAGITNKGLPGPDFEIEYPGLTVISSFRNIFFTNFAKLPETVQNNKDYNAEADIVFFLDLTPSEDMLLTGGFKDNSVVIIDHHKDVVERTKYYGESAKRKIIEVKHPVDYTEDSAASLAAKFVREQLRLESPSEENVLQSFGEVVADYDLWKHKIPVSNILGKAATVVAPERFYSLLRQAYLDTIFMEVDVPMINSAILSLSSAKSWQIEQNIEVAKRYMITQDIEIDYKKVPVIFSVVMDSVNEVSQALADEADEVPIVALYSLSTERIHLRTNRDDVDLGFIAKQYGGGGHASSASFPVKWIVGQNKLMFDHLLTKLGELFNGEVIKHATVE